VSLGSFITARNEYTCVEPGSYNMYRHIIKLPLTARFVLVSTRFKYEDGASDFQSSTRLVSAPTSSIAASP
jgi:hypothetical protein